MAVYDLGVRSNRSERTNNLEVSFAITPPTLPLNSPSIPRLTPLCTKHPFVCFVPLSHLPVKKYLIDLYNKNAWPQGGTVVAAHVRGTGIGCYFDDEVHELLGISSQTFQSLYHFTVGGAVNDERLQTLAPYAHLQRE